MVGQNGTLIAVGGNGTTELFYEQDRCLVRKTLFFEQEPERTIIDAFQEECQILSNIIHPALPKVLEHKHRGNNLTLVLEVSAGESLADRINADLAGEFVEEKGSGFNDTHAAGRWATELCDAIAFLHSQRPFPLIHRNLTPQRYGF